MGRRRFGGIRGAGRSPVSPEALRSAELDLAPQFADLVLGWVWLRPQAGDRRCLSQRLDLVPGWVCLQPEPTSQPEDRLRLSRRPDLDLAPGWVRLRTQALYRAEARLLHPGRPLDLDLDPGWALLRLAGGHLCWGQRKLLPSHCPAGSFSGAVHESNTRRYA